MIQKYSFPTLRKYKTILWNDLTIKRIDLTWNNLTMKQNDHKPTRSAICSITFKLNPKLSPCTTCQLQQTTMIQKYSFPTKKLEHLQVSHQNEQQH